MNARWPSEPAQRRHRARHGAHSIIRVPLWVWLAAAAAAVVVAAGVVVAVQRDPAQPVSAPAGGQARTTSWPITQTPYVGMDVPEDGPTPSRTTPRCAP